MNNKACNLNNPLLTFFHNTYIKDAPTETLKTLEKHGTSALEQLHSSIGTLGKFLFIGVQDKEIGILKEEDVSDMAWHIQSIGEICREILSIKEQAKTELNDRQKNIV